jgi:hypothetical protein
VPAHTWYPNVARALPESVDIPVARAASKAVVLAELAAHWRGQLDPRTRQLVPCLAPGSPDRTALLVRRMASCPDLPTNGQAPD